METPEISPGDYDDLDYVLTAEEREWADELRDEFIIIANNHFTNIITPNKAFIDELTSKFNDYIRQWMEKNPIVTCIDDPDKKGAIICTTDAGILHALRQARDEVCVYLEKEFGHL
jgi:hypothetical protein